jgi:hypothetical protein
MPVSWAKSAGVSCKQMGEGGRSCHAGHVAAGVHRMENKKMVGPARATNMTPKPKSQHARGDGTREHGVDAAVEEAVHEKERHGVPQALCETQREGGTQRR